MDFGQQQERQQELENSIRQQQLELEKTINHKVSEQLASVSVISPATSTPMSSRLSSRSINGNQLGRKKPQTFDGKVPWEAYHAQFEILAKLCGWTDEEKAAQLSTSLTGSALEVLTKLDDDERHDYEQLVAVLKQKYGAEHKQELYRAKFRNRKRQVGEKLQDLFDDLENLSTYAYPTADRQLIKMLVKDQFCDALDGDLQIYVKQAKPKSAQEALATALESEAILKTCNQRKKFPDSGFVNRKANFKSKFGQNSKFVQNSRTSTDSSAFQGASGANGSKNNVDELLSKLTSILDSYKTGSQQFNTAAKVFKPQRKVYDPCIYCSKSNHESSRCYFKPANATTQNQSLNN